jgi:hypothetical protein
MPSTLATVTVAWHGLSLEVDLRVDYHDVLPPHEDIPLTSAFGVDDYEILDIIVASLSTKPRTDLDPLIRAALTTWTPERPLC